MVQDIGENIKNIRKEKGLLQKQLASDLGISVSFYNKIENGQREASIKILDKLSKIFGVTVDFIINPESKKPVEIDIENKTELEQFRLINKLEKRQKEIIFEIINTMLTKQQFKDFFQKNLAIS